MRNKVAKKLRKYAFLNGLDYRRLKKAYTLNAVKIVPVRSQEK